MAYQSLSEEIQVALGGKQCLYKRYRERNFQNRSYRQLQKLQYRHILAHLKDTWGSWILGKHCWLNMNTMFRKPTGGLCQNVLAVHILINEFLYISKIDMELNIVSKIRILKTRMWM